MRTTLEVLREAVRSPLSILPMGWFHVCNLSVPKRAKRPTRCWSAYEFIFVRVHLAARVSPWNVCLAERVL